MEQLRSTDPTVVSGYTVIARLGSGGMGRVFLARSPGGRKVALKMIRAELAEDGNFRERFRREVAAARMVSGVFTAPVIDADIDATPPWLATAYVAGLSLADTIERDGPLPLRNAQLLAAGLAEALGAIHRVGVVHRDLTPTNILLADDGPRVIDFGIARAADESRLTHTGLLMGKPAFMAPEQVLGHEGGPPADMFALGAVLFYALTGRGPYGTGTAPQMLYRVVHSRPEFTSLPEPMRDLVAWCMDAMHEQRPTAEQLLQALVPAGAPVAELVMEGWTPYPGTSKPEPAPRAIGHPMSGVPIPLSPPMGTPMATWTSSQAGSQQAGSQQAGSQQAGSQQAGSQQAGNQHPGTQHTGPQHIGDRHDGDRPSGDRHSRDRHSWRRRNAGEQRSAKPRSAHNWTLRTLTRPIFNRRRVLRGYDVRDVDRFVDRIMESAESTGVHAHPSVTITADEIHNVRFGVQFQGYDEWQVDTWLEEAEAVFRDQQRTGERLPG